MRVVSMLSIVLLPFLSPLYADVVNVDDAFYNQSFEALLGTEIETKAKVGTRKPQRDILRSKNPLDVVTSEQIESSGLTQLSLILEKYLPGFSVPRSSITDGTDHVKLFTLRGLYPDQVLVLINGKRLHSSALVNVNSSIQRGTTGVDINTIALGAIDRVEVLRDGAAAQYGSDAIAGVINIVLKAAYHDNVAAAHYGQTNDGDGETKFAQLFYALPLAGDGFVNIAAEYRDQGRTNRAGLDYRDQYPEGDVRNDGVPVQNGMYGDPEVQDLLLSLASRVYTGGSTSIYVNAQLDKRDSSAAAFFRRAADGRNDPQIYPDGFLPMIEPEITDMHGSVGTDGKIGGVAYDLSQSVGYNDYHYHVNNTLNRSLGADSPTSFDAGSMEFLQATTNLDLSQAVGSANIAAGVEYRYEQYRIKAGEEPSYVLGTYSSNAGAQGFPGFRPENVTDVDRDSIAAYADVDYQFSDALGVDVALRYENYSDFGSTFDGKAVLNYRLSEALSVRASTSTGFRAPSLQQSNYTATVINNADGTNFTLAGTFGVNHPLSKALGAQELTPEHSVHYTAGMVYVPDHDLSMSVDYFYVDIDDRIVLSNNIRSSSSSEAAAALQGYGIDSARYFTNALDTKTDGVDLRLDYRYRFEDGSRLKTAFKYSYARTRITSFNTAPAVLGENAQDILVGGVTQNIIEHGQPSNALAFFGKYTAGAFDVVVNVNRVGSHIYLFGVDEHKIDAMWLSDVALNYRVNRALELTMGAENLFDQYPKQLDPTGSTLAGEGKTIPYSQFTPFGYNGAYYYGRMRYRF